MSDKPTPTSKGAELNDQIDSHLFGTEGRKGQHAITVSQAKVLTTVARVRAVLSADGIEDSVNDNANLMRVLKTEDEKRSSSATADTPNVSKQISKAAKAITQEMDISTLFSGEETRIRDYQVYSQIADHIVQVLESVETYADNILSPDSFNSTSLPITYKHTGTTDEIRERIDNRIEVLNEKYNVYSKIENAIKKSLYLGDYFIATLDLTRRTSELLSESSGADVAYKSSLTKDDIQKVISAESVAAKNINEDYNYVSNTQNELGLNDNDALSEAVLSETVANFMDGMCTINEDTSAMARSIKRRENIYNSDISKSIATRKGVSAKAKLKFNKSLGTLVKEYDPQNVIKITDGNIVFGYLLIDYNDTTYSQLSAKASDSVFKNMTDSFSSQTKTTATKRYLDIITKSIVAKVKLNPQIIEDNAELADIFYNAILRAKHEGKQFAVTFAHPNEVHHFKPTSDTYGVSILDKIKFFAKLYIGVLTNAFMSNAIRKNERLAYYIDVSGNDDDAFNSVQDLIRSIKQREIKFSNIDSISTVLNSAGEFHDFFIPTTNGNRPVDIEPISLGQPKDIDSAFIEFLKKNIVAGIGIPASFTNSMEEVEFARSLTMDSGKFLRRVIRLQGHYNGASTGVIREIYDNEYVSKATNTPKTSGRKRAKTKAKITVEEQLSTLPSSVFRIKYPTPSTLSTQVQEEQLQTVMTQAETLTDIEIDDSNDKLRRAFKRLLVRKMLPSIDWSDIDRVKVEAERQIARESGTGDSADDDSEDRGYF